MIYERGRERVTENALFGLRRRKPDWRNTVYGEEAIAWCL